MEDVPEGLFVHELLRDLRFIKLSSADRSTVLRLGQEFKVRHLTYEEARTLRVIHRRHAHAIQELKKAEEAARVSMSKEARGHHHVNAKLKEAAAMSAARKKQDAEAFQLALDELAKSKKDYGF